MDTATLWLAVAALGLYHGLNPAMGWPLAVANGLAERRARSVFATLLPLAGGHFLAVAVVLLPFAWLGWLMAWSHPIRIGAAVAVLLFGVAKLAYRRHPRLLARIAPTRLALWSFLMASTHGAGLMLAPVMLGLCAAPSRAGGIGAMADVLARATPASALLVAALHSAVALLAGIGMAWAVYRYLGLRFVRSAWLNTDVAWGASLVLAGVAGIALDVAAAA